eukprot:13023446-Heterocapsa_arctica.AAC.1
MEVLEKASRMISSQGDVQISYLPTVPQLVLVRSVIVDTVLLKMEVLGKASRAISSQGDLQISYLPTVPQLVLVRSVIVDKFP